LGKVDEGTQPVFVPQGTTETNVTTGGDGTVSNVISPLPNDDPRVALTINETLKAGVAFVNIACSATLDGVTTPRPVTGLDTSTETATVEINAGEEVRCTFDNTTIEVESNVVTRTDSGSGGGVLPFTGSDASILLKSAIWLLVLGAGLALVAGRRKRARI
jgi:hypothetical protein